jgi:cellulose biosynthesis protein BcsQ
MRVLVVDNDPRGTATNELGIEEAQLSQILTLNDLLAIPDKGDPADPAEAIGWAGNRTTPDEEIAQLLGVDVDQTADLRARTHLTRPTATASG